MICGLIEKEVRQHTTLLIFITLVMLTGLLALGSNKFLVQAGGSAFFLFSQLWFFILPMATLVLGTGLVATEFRNKTQLFLEGLPLPRWKMLAVKYLLGLGVVTGCTTFLLAGAWWMGRNAEVMTLNFALLLFTKSLGWSWFCWSVCFAHGFLGRYRIWVGVSLVIGLILIQQMGGVMITNFGPFDLISPRFAYERFVWPVEALWVTAALILVLTLAGFALGMVRDATVAAMMSEKMSKREKIVLTAMALAAMVAIGAIDEKQESLKPLNLPGSVDRRQGPASVSAAAAVAVPSPAEEQALEAHATAVAGMLAEVGAYLECASLPPVYLVHRRDFIANQFEVDESKSPKRIIIRRNLLITSPSDTKFESQILISVLGIHQLGRLSSDTRGWVLDGFAAWWPVRKIAKTPADFMKLQHLGEEPPVRTLRGDDLKNWLMTIKDLTPAQQSTLAGLGMIALGEYGEQPRQRFLAKVLGYSAPMDARATLHDWFHPVSRIMKSTTGSDLESLARKWTAALQQEEAGQ